MCKKAGAWTHRLFDLARGMEYGSFSSDDNRAEKNSEPQDVRLLIEGPTAAGAVAASSCSTSNLTHARSLGSLATKVTATGARRAANRVQIFNTYVLPFDGDPAGAPLPLPYATVSFCSHSLIG